MGYSWTSISTGDIIRASHFNEFKTNIDSLYSDLELPAPSWTYLPVAAKDIGINERLKEVREKVDYADDMNYCRNDNTSHDINVDNSEHSSYCTGYNYGVDGAYDSGINSGDDAGYDITDNGIVYNAHYPYADSDHDWSHDDYVATGNNVGDDNGVNYTHHATFT